MEGVLERQEMCRHGLEALSMRSWWGFGNKASTPGVAHRTDCVFSQIERQQETPIQLTQPSQRRHESDAGSLLLPVTIFWVPCVLYGSLYILP